MIKISSATWLRVFCSVVSSLAAVNAYAVISIGDISVQSFRDEAFNAYVELQTEAGEALTPQCLSLDKPEAEPDNKLPYLTDAAISLDAHDSKKIVNITTTQPVHDTGINLLLKIQCPGQLQVSRDFTVFLGTRSGNVLALPVEPQAASKPLPGPLPEGGGFYWGMRPGDTLAAIAQKIYPKERLYQKKMVQAILRANPQVFPDGKLQELPIGTVIIIPDLRTVPAVKVPGETRSEAPPRKSQRKPKPPPASSKNEPPDKKTAGKRHALARGSQYLLKISWQLDSVPSSRLSETIRRPPGYVPAAENPYLAKANELGQRVLRIDAGLEEIKLKLEKAFSQSALVERAIDKMEKPVGAVKTAPAPVVPAPEIIQARHDTQGNMTLWLALGATGLSALLGLGAVYYYRKKASPFTAIAAKAERTLTPDLDLDIEEKAPAAPALAADHAAAEPRPHQPSMDLLLENAGEEPGVADEQIDVELLFDPTKSLVDDVNRFVALGRPKGAISLLKDQINKHMNDRISWLKLLAIYHNEGMITDFDKVVKEFKKIFRDKISMQALNDITSKPPAWSAKFQ
jgi:phage tail protein X